MRASRYEGSRTFRTAPATRPARAPDQALLRVLRAGICGTDLHHCTSCHRPGLVGQEQAARLAGQDFDYLLRLLRAFKARTASDLDGTMTVATQPLTDDEIVSLVHFVATLGEP